MTHALERIHTEDPQTIAAEITSELLRVNPAQSNVIHIRNLLAECYKDLQRAHENKDRIVSVPTGLNEFENYCGGMSRGISLCSAVVHGRAKLAWRVPSKNAAAAGYPIAFVSAESDPQENNTAHHFGGITA